MKKESTLTGLYQKAAQCYQDPTEKPQSKDIVAFETCCAFGDSCKIQLKFIYCLPVACFGRLTIGCKSPTALFLDSHTEYIDSIPT